MSAEHSKDDYQVFTSTGGIVTLKDWSQVRLTGSDRVTFLHNMCTSDIRRLDAGQMGEAFLLDVKGKIVAHILVITSRDCLWLLAVPDQAGTIIKHLDRYIVREDVQLTDLTKDFEWHIALGPLATDVSDQAALVAPCDLLWPAGNLLQTAKSSLRRFATFPMTDTDSLVWTTLRAESFLPLFCVDFDQSLPQEVNRDARAISFTKGCYLGQETVARIDALGHVNKKLVLVTFDGTIVPPAGTKINADGQDVGAVTTSVWSPRYGTPLGIVMIRRGTNDVGTKLTSAFGNAEVVLSHCEAN